MTTHATAGAHRRGSVAQPRMIALELRRMMRNRRTVLFTLVYAGGVLPRFGLQAGYRALRRRQCHRLRCFSMAVYGAMLATTSGGAMVAIERAPGWSRSCG